MGDVYLVLYHDGATVYNGLLKRARANLHLDFVRWADRVNADSERGLEYEEILGYHLEQAHRYLRELGPLRSLRHSGGWCVKGSVGDEPTASANARPQRRGLSAS